MICPPAGLPAGPASMMITEISHLQRATSGLVWPFIFSSRRVVPLGSVLEHDLQDADVPRTDLDRDGILAPLNAGRPVRAQLAHAFDPQ